MLLLVFGILWKQVLMFGTNLFDPFSIGRVTGRLPKELADDVVGSVLDCFRFVYAFGTMAPSVNYTFPYIYIYFFKLVKSPIKPLHSVS